MKFKNVANRMVKCETAVNHHFQQEIASSERTNSSATKSPSILTLNNEISLSPIEKKTWILSEEDGSDSKVYCENGNPLEDVHYVHELPLADEERLEKLFNQLDRNGNGKIDVHDLSAALKEFGLSSQYAEVSSWLTSFLIYWIFQPADLEMNAWNYWNLSTRLIDWTDGYLLLKY